MKVKLDKIIIKDRVRKSFGNIEDLAQDIKENGLISIPTITPEGQLIAGERRLRAIKMLGWKEVECNIIQVKDAIHLRECELAENENRRGFTFSEKMEWAELIEKEFKILGSKNMTSGKSLGQDCQRVNTRKEVAALLDISEGTYQNAKLIWDAYLSGKYEELPYYIDLLDSNKAKVGGIVNKVKKLINGLDPNEKKPKKENVEENNNDDRIAELEEQITKLNNENAELKKKKTYESKKVTRDRIGDFLNESILSNNQDTCIVLDIVSQVRHWCDQMEDMVRQSSKVEAEDIMDMF